MVKKTRNKKVWQNKLQITKDIQKLSIIQQPQKKSISESSNSQQIQNSSSYQDSEQRFLQNRKYQSKNNEQQQVFKYSQNNDQSEYFEISDKIINQLNQKVYKQIVLPEFIQTNLNTQIIDNQIQNYKFQTQNYTDQFQVRKQEIKKISDFFFSDSLNISPYYLSFNKLFPVKQINKQFKSSFIQQTLSKWTKREALLYFNTNLLESANLKFLNIYGPTGSGKTFTLKSIIANKKLFKNIIWINGMNITQGKIKKVTSDLKIKFDTIMWQIYKKETFSQQFSQFTFQQQLFNKKNERILIIDQYDQINGFAISDLLRYAYIQGLKYQQRSYNMNKNKLVYISKIVFVSNNFGSIKDLLQQQNTRSINNIYQQKIVYQEHLVFRPLTERQTESILTQKIWNVNNKFNIIHDKLKFMFLNQKIGIFPLQKMKNLIKKICISEQIDIRKIMQFYVNSFKQWIQSVIEWKQNCFKNHEKKQKILMKKFTNYLIDQNFLLQQSTNLVKNKYQIVSSQDDSNPVLFYLSHLEKQGRCILKAIHESLLFKKRMRYIDYIQSSHNKNKTKINSKNKTDFRIEDQFNSKITCQSKRFNSIRILDFYKKIKPKVQFFKIHQWIYEWQQLGIIKIKKNKFQKSFQEQVGISYTQQIKIIDNYQIQVLDKQSIQQALQLLK